LRFASFPYRGGVEVALHDDIVGIELPDGVEDPALLDVRHEIEDVLSGGHGVLR
jgi:hypothetical protein